jgi:hypothetical protein
MSINLIKTPTQILYEQAGIPHLAGGKAVPQLSAGAAMLAKDLIKKAEAHFGRPLKPDEIAQIQFHASGMSKPTSKGIPTNPARLAGTTPHPNLLVDEAGYGYRASPGPAGLTTPEYAKGYIGDPFAMTPQNMKAREEAYQLGTRQLKTKIGGDTFASLPTKLKVIDDRDPFLTEAMTGRKPSGTYQKPFTTNIDDLVANKAALEQKGIYEGHSGTGAGDLPTQSTTPSADFFAERAAAIENAKLPMNIRSLLREKLGREPTQDEINKVIADLNVVGHDYTGQGSAAFANERPFPKGRPTKEQEAEIAAYRQNAIDSGISPSALKARGTALENEYPSLAREREWGPEKKTGGHISADDMRHMMMAHGHTPGHFKEGGSDTDWNQMIWEHTKSHPDFYDTAPKFAPRTPDTSERIADVISSGMEKIGSTPLHARKQGEQVSDVLDYGSMFVDPLAIPRGIYEVAHGEPVAGAMDIAFGAPGAYATYKSAKSAAPKALEAAKALPKVGGALSRVLGPISLALTPSELGDSTLDAWNKRRAK